VTPELAACFRDSSCLDYLSVTIDKKVDSVFMLRIEDAASVPVKRLNSWTGNKGGSSGHRNWQGTVNFPPFSHVTKLWA